MAKKVNPYSDYAFQVDIQVRDEDTGELVTPAAGAVTGIKFRLSTAFPDPADDEVLGEAIDPDVDNLDAAEVDDTPGRFAYVMDTDLMVEHLVPLGHGTSFYLIPSKQDDMDMEAIRYTVNLRGR